MRNLILQEIRRRDDEPMSRICELVRADFYRGTALSRLILGTDESVQGCNARSTRLLEGALSSQQVLLFDRGQI